MASGSCGTRDKLNPLRRPVRESVVLVGATLPAKKGQVYFGRFYLGKRRVPAVNCPHLSHGDQRRFRKYAANFGLAEHTGVLR